jgi:hypothetical protein
MKNLVNAFVFVYSEIKKNFFNLINAKNHNTKNEFQEENFADEYHKAFAGVTRWQTL